MQRDDVAQRVRSGAYSAPGYAAPGAMTGAARYRPGWGAVAGAATAGGLLGYMFGSHGGYGYGGGMMGGGGGMGSLLLLLLIVGGGIYFLTRRRTPTVSPRQVWADSSRQSSWPNQSVGGGSAFAGGGWTEDAEGIFRELQSINSRKDEAALRQYCTAALARDLMPNMGGITQVVAIRSEVVDQQDGLVSVRYQGTVMEEGQHPEQVDELWHFVRNPGSGRPWLLSGIQPL
ncbi:MAG: hypothetical protein HKM02_03155 [Pseudomonadales bacterium]|nr:hypothetical protein [Pseudomonadales bacterium]